MEYSLQVDHLHMIVEAADKEALACGMKAVGSRLANAVQRVFARSGRVLAVRYHGPGATTYGHFTARKKSVMRLRTSS